MLFRQIKAFIVAVPDTLIRIGTNSLGDQKVGAYTFLNQTFLMKKEHPAL
jgi:hypothetical protein